MGSTLLITPVLLSGGGGTRLWPISVPAKPKQLLALASERTMLQETALRVTDGDRYAAPVLIANHAHANEIDAQLASIGCAPAVIVLEPIGRNTAPAIALAALVVAPETILLIMPSDHVIHRLDRFHEAVARALPFALGDWLVTFGIAPTAPETGYGYIRLGEALGEAVHRVDRFVEKPSKDVAEAMLAAGNHVWNGGIFLLKAGAFLEALRLHAPAILDQVRASIAAAERLGERLLPDANLFASSPSDSIDFAVMEKADRVAVIPVDMEWSDVGSWDALHTLGPLDAHRNLALGAVDVLESQNCLVLGDGVRVSVLGISDLIVVASKNQVIVLPRGRSQEVKRLLAEQ